MQPLPAIAVLDEAIQSLRDDRKLSARWHPRAVSGLPRTDNAFSLEPDIDADRSASLYQLQTDAARLSEFLPAALRTSVQKHKLELSGRSAPRG
ncbi:MAG: hypothetical protein EXQ88_06980 [Alphaproteobacteria bacterium]|nr:hypothetical protein [Alphaproteobacteria bacterium]